MGTFLKSNAFQLAEVMDGLNVLRNEKCHEHKKFIVTVKAVELKGVVCLCPANWVATVLAGFGRSEWDASPSIRNLEPWRPVCLGWLTGSRTRKWGMELAGTYGLPS